MRILLRQGAAASWIQTQGSSAYNGYKFLNKFFCFLISGLTFPLCENGIKQRDMQEKSEQKSLITQECFFRW